MHVDKKVTIGFIIALIILVIIGIIILVQPKNSNNDSTENTEILSTEIYSEETENIVIETEVFSEESTNADEEVLNTENDIQSSQLAWTVTDMDKTMYAKSSVNVRKGPGTEYERLGSLSTNQEVIVTGKCNEYDWYRIDYNGNEAYVSINYLMDEKVVVNNSNNQEVTNTNDQNNNESIDSDYIEEENNAPSTPEPAIGTISYTLPDDEWIWVPVDVIDTYYTWGVVGWNRYCNQSTMFAKEYPQETLRYYADKAYPLRTDVAEDGYTIEHPTFWIYLGDGPM